MGRYATPPLKSLVEDAQDRHDSNESLPDHCFPPLGHAVGWRERSGDTRERSAHVRFSREGTPRWCVRSFVDVQKGRPPMPPTTLVDPSTIDTSRVLDDRAGIHRY